MAGLGRSVHRSNFPNNIPFTPALCGSEDNRRLRLKTQLTKTPMTEHEIDNLAELLSDKIANKLEQKKNRNWKDDPRAVLLGEWYSLKSDLEFSVRYEWFGFVMYLYHASKNGDSKSKIYSIHKGESDREFYIIRNGKIVEMILEGDAVDITEEPDDETEEPILEWENDRFVQDARSHKFYYDTHLMWEEDELALEAIRKENQAKRSS